MSPPLILLVDDNAELAELLAQILEEAGYRTRSTQRGKTAINGLSRELPAMAIVDILLPDVVGYEVGAALRAKNVPFVFMTGVFKGGRHAMDAVKRHGARAFFEKPFDAEQLLAKVREIVPPPPRSGVTAEEGLIIELHEEVDEGDYTPMAPIEMTGRVQVSGDTVKAAMTGQDLQLRSPTRDTVVRRTPPAPPPPGDAIPPPETTLRVRMPDGPLNRRGELRDNLPALINAFAIARESGELGLQRGKVKKVIYFQDGAPVFALSNLAADRFGSFLARTGKIRQDQLQVAADRATREHRRTGDILIEMGILRETEKIFYVAQQVKAIIYSCFAWEDGAYVLSFQERARAEPVRLGVHPAHLIQRGIKKIYRPERLERLIALEDRPIPSEDPAYQLSEIELEPWEATMLSRITGDRTVAELVAIAGKPVHQVYASLAALLALRILEKR